MNFQEVLKKFERQEGIDRTEGPTGVKNLCRLLNAMGYKDSQHFGQFHPKGSYGDLINFLEDNSGAVEAIKEWIANEIVDEWKEALESQLPLKNAYEDGVCPDCQEDISDDAEEGSECGNCGHVFCEVRDCD